MNTPLVSIIAAVGRNRELGKDNRLLWNIPEDMAHFKERTSGHPIIMGRKTYESIGRPLPNRTNIVITHDIDYKLPMGVYKVPTIEEAIEIANLHEITPADPSGEKRGEIFVIGGAQIYKLAMQYADKIYLTVVDHEFSDADAHFPDYSEFQVIKERKSKDHNYSYSFLELAR